jgi:lipid-A-disaccharide synthase
MAVILPFEAAFYEQAGLPVTFVGHPLLDMVQVSLNREEAAASFGLDPSRKIVGLFPGSRNNEIERLLPVIIESARVLEKQLPGIQFVVPSAATLNQDDLAPPFLAAGIDVTFTHESIHDLIRACDAVISVSGTVTLEVALIGTPMVIIYKLSPLTYMLAKRLVKIEHIGLCNIIAGETVVRELIQHEANPDMISAEIGKILGNLQYADEIKQKLSSVRSRLKSGGASANVARLALSMMEAP